MELVLLYFFHFIFFGFANFLHCHSITQDKTMTAEEFAQMPNCNLTKSICNKWLQTPRNKGGNQFQAFLEVVAYNQF